MDAPHKILILDDDADWLDMCRDSFAQLPSSPDVRTTTSSARALAMLESESFRLLVCDLKMPRMDGLQVLTIVRRRFPQLRTVVLSGLEDEEFRSRAYALGVDQFWLKNDMQGNSKMFMECLESLLGRDEDGGFRGVQSKSLIDIIQMECLSRNSTVLRVTRGPLVAKIWLRDGELIDAEAEGARGEVAFRRILAWRSGTFENLPPEPDRPRTITNSINALLLESAQTMDENANPSSETQFLDASHRKTIWKLSLLTGEGAEFVVAVPPEGSGEPEALGTQATEQLAGWTRLAAKIAKKMSDKLEAGPLSHIAGSNLDKQYVLLPDGEKTFLVGWPPDAVAGQVLEQTKKLTASWDS